MTTQNISEGLRKYSELANKGAYLAAIVQLGELCRGPEAQRERSTLEEELKAIVPNSIAEAARREGVDRLEQATRILEVGTTFTWDELVLALTLRVQIGLACEVFRTLGVPYPNTGHLDELLKGAARSVPNRETFARAVAALRQNWPIPLEDIWSK